MGAPKSTSPSNSGVNAAISQSMTTTMSVDKDSNGGLTTDDSVAPMDNSTSEIEPLCNGKPIPKNEETEPTSSSPTPQPTAIKVKRSRLATLTVWSFSTFIRTLFMEFPLFLLFGAYMSTHVMERFAKDYILPQQNLQDFASDVRRGSELTYYHRHCDERDITTRDATDLIVNYDTMTPEDAMHHQLKHGAQIYPDLLSEETAQEIRNWILSQNEKNEDMIPVIENENRWSFGVRVDQDPSVGKALNEVLSNEFLVQAMEKIMGPNPAVIEFTGITSAYGAAVQRYHSDVVPEGNGAKWGRNFIPSYSLFIPLQNTSAAMGATELCPGSHMCADGCFDYCPELGFQSSGPQDNWPMGWGALVNQQTMHRGTAHTDPNAPHRVVFIVTFAPRPQFGQYQLETRSQGQGGSYSLHWTQWGHTLYDFRNVNKYMQQPWKLLRSLGFYKPKGRQWGWDYITQISARIANDENGVKLDDFYLMMEQNQFKYVPKRLHGKVLRDYRQNSRQIWNNFYMETMVNVRNEILSWHFKAVAVYVVLMLSISFLFSKQWKNRAFSVAGGITRLVLTHAVVFGLSWLILHRVAHSTFGRNIRYQRAYTWPQLPHHWAPVLPSTLPLREDIMIFDDMQSEYLYSYTEVFDVFHPGNLAWSEMLSQYSGGYKELPPSMKPRLCSTLLKWSHQQGRRILVKNLDSNWAEADRTIKARFCQKEMMKRSNPYTKHAIRHLDFLLTETRFGYWRDTNMHKKHISSRLTSLQNQIMTYVPTDQDAREKSIVANNLAAPEPSETPELLHGRFSLPSIPIHKALPRKAFGSRPVIISEEADVDMSQYWLEEGDQVEAAYGSLATEWYRATISEADADDYKWDVVYDDGDEEEGLCFDCVRHPMPYKEGENLEWRADDNIYYRALIVIDNGDDTFDIEVDGEYLENVSASDFRRVAPFGLGTPLPGTPVVARYPGESGWYPGILGAINSDGSYAIQFEDGDFVQEIDPRLVRVQDQNQLLAQKYMG